MEKSQRTELTEFKDKSNRNFVRKLELKKEFLLKYILGEFFANLNFFLKSSTSTAKKV